MATVVLDNARYRLETQDDSLIIRDGDERRGSIPIKMIDRLILQGNLGLEVDVLRRLGESGASILCLSARHSRRVALVLGPRHNDAAIRLGQAEHVTDTTWCTAFARRQVRAKVRGQIRLLARAMGKPTVRPKRLADAIKILATLETKLPEASTTSAVRGIEGAAARVYFGALAELFPLSIGFTGRNRRPPRDPANACLSLAYTLLHYEAVHAAHTAGLDPLLGFYHRPAFGRESLASDLIEPLRPRVDVFVVHLFASRQVRAEHFSHDGQACLLSKAGRRHFYAAWEQEVHPLRRALRRECRILVDAMRRTGESHLNEPEDDEG